MIIWTALILNILILLYLIPKISKLTSSRLRYTEGNCKKLSISKIYIDKIIQLSKLEKSQQVQLLEKENLKPWIFVFTNHSRSKLLIKSNLKEAPSKNSIYSLDLDSRFFTYQPEKTHRTIQHGIFFHKKNLNKMVELLSDAKIEKKHQNEPEILIENTLETIEKKLPIGITNSFLIKDEASFLLPLYSKKSNCDHLRGRSFVFGQKQKNLLMLSGAVFINGLIPIIDLLSIEAIQMQHRIVWQTSTFLLGLTILCPFAILLVEKLQSD